MPIRSVDQGVFMKKLTLFTALSLSLFMLASCGKDEKKKNNDLTISGIINPQNCFPQSTNGVQIPPDLAQQITQQCSSTHRQQVMTLSSQRFGQPVFFTATYIQNGFNNGLNSGFQNTQFQQPWGTTQWGGQQQWGINPQQQQGFGGSVITSLNFH